MKAQTANISPGERSFLLARISLFRRFVSKSRTSSPFERFGAAPNHIPVYYARAYKWRPNSGKIAIVGDWTGTQRELWWGHNRRLRKIQARIFVLLCSYPWSYRARWRKTADFFHPFSCYIALYIEWAKCKQELNCKENKKRPCTDTHWDSTQTYINK